MNGIIDSLKFGKQEEKVEEKVEETIAEKAEKIVRPKVMTEGTPKEEDAPVSNVDRTAPIVPGTPGYEATPYVQPAVPGTPSFEPAAIIRATYAASLCAGSAAVATSR